MKAKGISSKVEVKAGVMNYTLKDVASGETQTVAINLNDMIDGFTDLPELIQRVIGFGVRTRVRNETAGKSFKEACADIAATLKEWQAGVWASARRAGGEGRHSILALAIARVAPEKYTPESAAALINSKVAGVLAAAGIDMDAEDDETAAAIKKARSDVKAAFFKNHPKVKAAHDTIIAERTAEKAKLSAIAAEGDSATL